MATFKFSRYYLLALILFVSCERKDDVNTNTFEQDKGNIPTNKMTDGSQCEPCNPTIPNTGTDCATFITCANTLLGGASQKSFIIHWQANCLSNSSVCPNSLPTSNLLLCYQEKCGYLNCYIDQLPGCLSACLPTQGFCVPLTPSCASGDYIFSWTAFYTGGYSSVYISADPVITVHCQFTSGAGSTPLVSECVGEFSL